MKSVETREGTGDVIKRNGTDITPTTRQAKQPPEEAEGKACDTRSSSAGRVCRHRPPAFTNSPQTSDTAAVLTCDIKVGHAPRESTTTRSQPHTRMATLEPSSQALQAHVVLDHPTAALPPPCPRRSAVSHEQTRRAPRLSLPYIRLTSYQRTREDARCLPRRGLRRPGLTFVLTGSLTASPFLSTADACTMCSPASSQFVENDVWL